MAVNGKQDMTNALNTPSTGTPGAPGPNDVAAFAGPGSAFQKFIDQKYNYKATMNPEQQRILAKQKQYEGALPELSYGTMFPSANTPIQKGTYGGSVVGNVPLFAPSMLTPFGVFDAKQRAMEDAAAKKAQEIDAFYKLAAPPQTKRVAVQGELNDEFYRGLTMWQDNAKAAYGDDWPTALKNDVGFNGWLNSFGTVARYEDQIVDQVAYLQEVNDNPDLVVSQEALDAGTAFMNGIGGMSNPMDPAGHNLGSLLMASQAQTNLDVAVNDAVSKFANDPSGTVYKAGEESTYNVYNETTKRGMTEEQVEAMANGILIDQYGGKEGMFTKEMIKDRIRALFPRVTKTTLAGTPSTRQPGASDGSTQTYSSWDQPSEYNTGWSFAGQATPEVSPVTSVGGVQHTAPITIQATKGQKLINNETGTPSQLADGTVITLGETRIVPTTKEGVIIPDSEVEFYLKNAPSQIQYSVITSGTYVDKDADGNEVKRTVYTPADPIKAALVKKEVNGKTQLGVPVSEMQAKADKLNANKDFSVNIDAAKKKEGYKQAGQNDVPSQNAQPAPAPQMREYRHPNGYWYTVEEFTGMGYSNEEINKLQGR